MAGSAGFDSFFGVVGSSGTGGKNAGIVGADRFGFNYSWRIC